ncbi:MAG: alpha-isopropylmalate synthase regulatory domain-containing protein, partial [Christensenellales bacterium]
YYCTAVIKIRVGNKTRIQAAEGAGPVNALDLALRRALLKFYPDIGKMYLKDYKVRVLNPQEATASVVRVLITSAAEGKIWNTVGVSQDIIEASFLALVDSFDYYLSGRKALHGDK